MTGLQSQRNTLIRKIRVIIYARNGGLEPHFHIYIRVATPHRLHITNLERETGNDPTSMDWQPTILPIILFSQCKRI